jgi:hypothetical protein
MDDLHTVANYREYTGYEIDAQRCSFLKTPRNAALINKCAFSKQIDDADVCVGNPPYVRNQDLPNGWRERAPRNFLHKEPESLCLDWQMRGSISSYCP